MMQIIAAVQGDGLDGFQGTFIEFTILCIYEIIVRTLYSQETKRCVYLCVISGGVCVLLSVACKLPW